jgi:hypothetical protein
LSGDRQAVDNPAFVIEGLKVGDGVITDVKSWGQNHYRPLEMIFYLQRFTHMHTINRSAKKAKKVRRTSYCLKKKSARRTFLGALFLLLKL